MIIRKMRERMICNRGDLCAVIKITLRQSHIRPIVMFRINHAICHTDIRRVFFGGLIFIIASTDLYKLWKYDAAINSTGDITPTVCMCNGCGRYSPPKKPTQPSSQGRVSS